MQIEKELRFLYIHIYGSLYIIMNIINVYIYGKSYMYSIFPCETIYQNIRNNYSKINFCSKFGPSLVICNYVKMY